LVDHRFVAFLGPVQRVADLLEAALERAPGAEALVGRYARYSYRELDAAVNAAAAAITALGVRPGDRFAVCMPNWPEIIVAFLATQRLGVVWVGLSRHLAPAEKAFILRDAGAKVLLSDPGGADQLEAADAGAPDLRIVRVDPAGPSDWGDLVAREQGAERSAAPIDPGVPAALAYTSGTTGFPKGAVVSQHGMLAVSLAAIWFGRGGQWDPLLKRGITLPLTTLNILIQAPFLAFLGGASVVCMDRSDALGVSEWIEAEGVEHIAAAPATLLDLLTRPDIPPTRLQSLRSVTAGGAQVPPRLRALFLERFGTPLAVGYGQTEAPASIAAVLKGRETPLEACGLPHEHLEVAILDGDDRPLPVGQDGEIGVRAARTGPWAGVYTPMLGYWNQPAETAAALRNGWLHTGDIGALDEDGFLYVRARRKEVIIRGGSNVYPAEVERILGADRDVVAVAVAGKPDERLGEVVVAFLELQPGADPSAVIARLRAECARELANYKAPVEWVAVDAMPRNAMNKILKGDLIARYFH
jgi:long-chain acyl-CoA synthetase